MQTIMCNLQDGCRIQITQIDTPKGLETKCWSKLYLDTSIIGWFTNCILHVNNNRSKLYRGYALGCNNNSILCGILQ